MTTVGELIEKLKEYHDGTDVRLVVRYSSMDHGDPMDGREVDGGDWVDVLPGVYSGQPVVEVRA